MNMNQNKIKKSNFTLILVATTLFVVVTSIIGIGFFVKRVVFIRQSFDLQGLFSPFACCNGILFQFKIAGLQLIQSRIRVCDQAAALV